MQIIIFLNVDFLRKLQAKPVEERVPLATPTTAEAIAV